MTPPRTGATLLVSDPAGPRWLTGGACGPEASRAKGTLQAKVQILKPDAFLTPELTAKVDFLAEEKL